MKLHTNATRTRRGAALVEYGLLVAGVAVVALAAVAILGHKVGDIFATSAAVLPGAHDSDNAPIAPGQLVNTTVGADGGQVIDASTPNQLSAGLGITQDQLDTLVIDTQAAGQQGGGN